MDRVIRHSFTREHWSASAFFAIQLGPMTAPLDSRQMRRSSEDRRD
jgi:hypothetical protein